MLHAVGPYDKHAGSCESLAYSSAWNARTTSRWRSDRPAIGIVWHSERLESGTFSPEPALTNTSAASVLPTRGRLIDGRQGEARSTYGLPGEGPARAKAAKAATPRKGLPAEAAEAA